MQEIPQLSGLKFHPVGDNKAPWMEKFPLEYGVGYQDGYDGFPYDPQEFSYQLNVKRAYGIGTPTGKLIVVDCDEGEKHGRVREGIKNFEAMANGKTVPETLTVRTPSGGLHYYFSNVDDLHIRSKQTSGGDKGNALAPDVDHRAYGGQIVTPYTPGYEVETDAPIADLPEWLADEMLKLQAPKSAQSSLYAQGGVDVGRLKAYVEKLSDKRAQDYERWRDVGMAIHHTLPSESGLFIWDAFSQRGGAAYEGIDVLRKKWKSFGKNGTPENLTMGSIVYWAKEDNPDAFDYRVKRGELTGAGNGKLFAERYSDDCAYVDGLGLLAYEDGVWKMGDEAKLRARQKAHELGLSFYDRAEKAIDTRDKELLGKWAKTSLSTTGVSSTLKEAAPYIYRPIAHFDKNRELLNLQNGVVNLATGAIQPHSPDLCLTQKSNFRYDANATCPKWVAALDMIFQGDAELIRYVRAAMGWTLTGRSDKKMLFFMYGPNGDNGKSTIVETLAGLMGDYALKTQSKTLMQLGHGSGDSFVAQFRGKRFVYTSETRDGQQWSSDLIKDLTGNDAISAKLLYENPFTFIPTHTLWVYGNDKPEVDDTGDAFWNRLKTVPFMYSIPKAQQRPMNDVKQDFFDESAGILNWLIDGYQDEIKNHILRNGEPSAMRAITAEYRLESDPLEQYLDLFYTRDLAQKTDKAHFVPQYNAWLQGETGDTWSVTKITKELGKKGIKVGGRNRRFYVGIISKN